MSFFLSQKKHTYSLGFVKVESSALKAVSIIKSSQQQLILSRQYEKQKQFAQVLWSKKSGSWLDQGLYKNW